MLNVFIGHLGNVYQTILMNTDVHKNSKIHNIADGSLEYHARCQILHIQYITSKHWFWHLITGIAGRFFQFLHDIFEGQLANAQFLCRFFQMQYFFGNLFQTGLRQCPPENIPGR